MGELLGVQLQPREIAELCYAAGWRDAMTLVTAVCVVLSESQGYTRAINVNPDGSRDRGIWQLNSIHKSYTDDVAYDPERATGAAYSLYQARNSTFADWAAFASGVYLHDSYIGRGAIGVANAVGVRLLARPVPDWQGQPYLHRLETPIADFRFRVGALMAANNRVAKELGWQAATKAKVTEVRGILAAVQGVVHRITPP